MRRRAVTAFALYYLATGAWPIAHMRSFEAVTGRKRDHWLVTMVGALAVANGAVLAYGSRRRELAAETVALAAVSALAFATIDVVYVVRGRIRPIYLADAALEAALAVLLLVPERAS